MTDDGEIKWFVTATGKNPMSGIESIQDQDKCMGIAYDEGRTQIAVLLQAKMGEVRSPRAGNWYDTVLLLMDAHSAELAKIVTINHEPEYRVDMESARNGILWVGGDVFFAGAA